MAANNQAIPADAPTDTGCPDLEDIAAFLDGTLEAERRAPMIEHLASCESCFEIFAGAARFQADEPQPQTTREPQRRPFERRWRVRSPAWRRGAAAAIAALLVASIAPLVWWRVSSAGAISPGGLSAELLKSPSAATLKVPWGKTFRNGN